MFLLCILLVAVACLAGALLLVSCSLLFLVLLGARIDRRLVEGLCDVLLTKILARPDLPQVDLSIVVVFQHLEVEVNEKLVAVIDFRRLDFTDSIEFLLRLVEIKCEPFLQRLGKLHHLHVVVTLRPVEALPGLLVANVLRLLEHAGCAQLRLEVASDLCKDGFRNRFIGILTMRVHDYIQVGTA